MVKKALAGRVPAERMAKRLENNAKRRGGILSFQAHQFLAYLFEREGREPDAVRHHRRALIAGGPAFEINLSISGLFGRLGKYQDSIEYAGKALQERPDDPRALTVLGTSLMNLRRFDDARAAFQQALRLNPDFVLPLLGEGILLRRQGRHDEALADFKRAAGHPDAPTESWVLFVGQLGELERWDEALDAAESALEERGVRSPMLRVFHATALARTGRIHEATRELLSISSETDALKSEKRPAGITDALEHLRNIVFLSHPAVKRTESYPGWQQRITKQARILVGKPVIRGTRISVELVIDLLAGGQTPEEIVARYPHISIEDVYACLDHDRVLLRKVAG